MDLLIRNFYPRELKFLDLAKWVIHSRVKFLVSIDVISGRLQIRELGLGDDGHFFFRLSEPGSDTSLWFVPSSLCMEGTTSLWYHFKFNISGIIHVLLPVGPNAVWRLMSSKQPLWLPDTSVLGFMMLLEKLGLSHDGLGADSAEHSPFMPNREKQFVFLVCFHSLNYR